MSVRIDELCNKEKVALVVVGYNRLESIKRLLSSLLVAKYEDNSVPLVISIDASEDKVLYDYVKNFIWPFGDLYINIQNERLGLKKHIIQCGDLTKYFKAIVILEDDVYVSEYFYNYVLTTVDYYGHDTRVAGISLIKNEMGYPGVPTIYLNNGCDTFLKQFPASWGECWTESQWSLFKQWYNSFNDNFDTIDIPKRAKAWKKAWSKYYMAYMVSTGRYFVYPYISLTTCFGDAGEHATSKSSVSQTNLLSGPKEYHLRPYEDMVKYDIYGTNESIYEWSGFSKELLCVDWYGQRSDYSQFDYVLTVMRLPLPIIKSYGLQMKPIELNVKNNIEGEGIFIYDTSTIRCVEKQKRLPLSMAFYSFSAFNINLALRYVLYCYSNILRKKLLFWK